MSKLLTEYHVAIGADTAKFVKQMGVARHEVSSVVKTLRESEPAANKLAREIANLDKVFAQNGLQSEQYALALEHLKRKYGETSVEVNRFDAFMRKNEETLSRGKKSVDAMTAAWQKHAALVKQAGNDAFAAGMRQMSLSRAWESASGAGGQSMPWQSKEAAQRASALNDAWARSMIAVGKSVPRKELLEYGRLLQDHISPNVEKARRQHINAAAAARSFGNSLAALGAVYAATSIVRSSVELGAGMEVLSAQFEALTGGRRSAEELISQMRRLDAETSMTITGISRAGQTMLSFGVAAEDVVPMLRKFGDIVGGDDERLKSLSLAFSQANAAGRLMGQDLLQMVQTGFNPLQVISQKTGVSMIDLKKAMEDGAISMDLVKMAFESATSAGGLFHERMQKEANTTMGQYRILNSEFQLMKMRAGEELLPVINDTMTGMRKLGESVEGTSFSLNHMVTGFRGSMAAMFDMLDAMQTGIVKTQHFDALLKSIGDRELAKGERMREEWIMRKAQKGEWDKLKEAGVSKGRINTLKKEMEEAKKLDEEMKSKLDEAMKPKENKEENAAIKTAQRELEQAQKRLEIEKFGRAIAEKNEALRAKVAEPEAEKLRLLIEQTEQLDAQHKLGEKMKREAEAQQEKIDKAKQAAREIGSTSNMNPELRRAGTVESYKFLMDKQNDQIKQLEAQKRIQAAQLEVQKRMAAGIEKMRPTVVLG